MAYEVYYNESVIRKSLSRVLYDLAKNKIIL